MELLFRRHLDYKQAEENKPKTTGEQTACMLREIVRLAASENTGLRAYP